MVVGQTHRYRHRGDKRGRPVYLCAVVGVLGVFVLVVAFVAFRQPLQDILIPGGSRYTASRSDSSPNEQMGRREKRRLRRRQERGRESGGGGTDNDKHLVINNEQSTRHQARGNNKNNYYSKVTCPDGTTGYLNDNYCDCSDGSDESATSACSHILVQKKIFKCADGKGAIFASRVQDGIQDCADGSDEKEIS